MAFAPGGISGLHGCSRHGTTASNHDAGERERLPRYWLHNVALLDKPLGSESRRIEGPTLVEVWPDGRVRVLADEGEAIAGYLPGERRKRPLRSSGLMLYVQREADLHSFSPTGHVIGLLHPGALVGVNLGDDQQVAIGQGDVAYVDQGVLGVEPVPLVVTRPANRGVARILPMLVLWDGGREEKRAAPCESAWFTADGHAYQSVRGVEVRYWVGDRFAGVAPRHYESLKSCPAHAVARHGHRLFLTQPAEDGSLFAPGVENEVKRIPEGFAEFKQFDRDPLQHIIMEHKSVFWMHYDEAKPSCDEWKFEEPSRCSGTCPAWSPARGVKASLQHRASAKWYPVLYDSHSGGAPHLYVDYARPNRWRGFLDYDYYLVGAEDDVLFMLGYSIPERMVAYDPTEVERWFLRRDKCESALREAVDAIERDGMATVRLGFHSDEG